MWRRIRTSPDWRYLAIVIPLMAALQAIGPETFRYERDWAQTGQVWRLVTAHWVHVGWMHLLLNSLGLVVIVTLTTPGWSIRRWVAQTLIMALGISILVWIFNPEVRDYAGHSGLLYGLCILGAVSLFRHDRLVAVLIVFAIFAKVLMEQFDFYNFDSGELIGARVIIDAHLYGFVLAIAIALAWRAYTMNHGPTERSERHEKST